MKIFPNEMSSFQISKATSTKQISFLSFFHLLQPARHSKLEKADILEKTVKHLQELQRQQAAMQQAADPKVINKFKAGFTDCANEVSRFPGLEPAVKRHLLQHLSNCINGVKTELHQHQRQIAAAQAQQLHAQMLPSPPSSPEQDQQHQHHHTAPPPPNHPYVVAPPVPQIQHTINGYFLPNGLQVIPTKLPNGSIALVLPQSLQQQQMQLQQSVATAPALQQPPMLVPIPSRTASTSSACSQHSASSYDRTLSSPHSSNSMHYAPPSPANSYEAMDCKTSVIQHGSSAAAQLQQPLSLVMKKAIKEEDQPWRPW